MKAYSKVLLALGALAWMGCENDILGAGENEISQQEQQEIVGLLDDMAFFADDFGDDGVPDASNMVVSLDGDERAPQGWGRRRGRPVDREVTIERRDDHTALVTKTLVFEGVFFVRERETEQVARKALNETRVQSALVTRLDSAEVNAETGRRHNWKLLAVSPAQYFNTDPAAQSVVIDSITVRIGDAEYVIDDPSELIDLEDRLVRVDVGTGVAVLAYASHVNGGDMYAYLHLFHAAPGVRIWRRMPMAWSEDHQAFVADWEVRHRGRERIIVDLLDAASLDPSLEDNYSANIWSVPFRTRILTDGAGDEG